MADLTQDELVEALKQAAREGSGNSNTTPSGSNFSMAPERKEIKTAMDAFTNALSSGGGRVSDLASGVEGLVPGIPVLKQLTQGAVGSIGYIENLQDTFNALSKVGAGGAADLGDLQRLAGVANLSLDSFANLVGTNSELLAGFAGGVDAGKRRFATLNKELYDTGLISQFKNLGYTSEEAAEFVLQNTETMRRSARLQGLTDAETVAVSANLAKNLSVIAKLSGKDAKQMQDDMVARQRDGATAAAIRLKEMEGASNAASNYDAILAVTAGLPDVAKDLIKDQIQLGAPLTEATQNFAAVNGEAARLAAEINQAIEAGASQEEVERLGKEYAAAVTGFAATAEGARIASLSQVSDVGAGQAEVFAGLKPQIDALDGVIEGNVTAMTTARQAADAYLENVKLLDEAVKKQAEVNVSGGPGQAALNFLNQGQIELAEGAGTVNQAIGDTISNNSAVVSSLNAGRNAVTDFSAGFEEIFNDLKQALPGLDSDETLTYLQDNIGQTLENGQVITQDLIDQYKLLTDPTSTGAEQLNAAESLQSAGLFDSQGNLKVAIMSVADQVRNSEVSGSVEETQEEAQSFFQKLFSFDQGTLGATGNLFKDFGSGMPAMLHGLEAVIPKDSVQGNLLEAFPGGIAEVGNMMQQSLGNMQSKFDPSALSDMASNIQAGVQAQTNSVAPPATSTMGTTSEDGIESLNQHLAQLVSINSRQLAQLERQLKAVKGMGGNVLSNVGL